MRPISRLLLVLAIATAAAACSKKKAATTPDSADRPQAPARGSATASKTPTSGVTVDRGGSTAPSFRAVYFEFDSTTLSSEARDELAVLAEWLVANPSAKITIEGHADERGTDEYNVALGERRAQVIREYLSRLGVASARLHTISYGEERPAVAGSSEEAWAQNRRGELRPE